MTHGLYKPHRTLGQMGGYRPPKPPRDRKLAALSIVVMLALAGLVWACDPALPRQIQMCASHGEMLQALARDFQEHVVARGTAPGGAAMEMLASPDGSTWTMLLIDPEKDVACIFASGKDWKIDSLPPGKDA